MTQKRIFLGDETREKAAPALRVSLSRQQQQQQHGLNRIQYGLTLGYFDQHLSARSRTTVKYFCTSSRRGFNRWFIGGLALKNDSVARSVRVKDFEAHSRKNIAGWTKGADRSAFERWWQLGGLWMLPSRARQYSSIVNPWTVIDWNALEMLGKYRRHFLLKTEKKPLPLGFGPVQVLLAMN